MFIEIDNININAEKAINKNKGLFQFFLKLLKKQANTLTNLSR